MGRAKRVADLFAGIGTFTFALAGGAEVDAFEQDEDAIAALAQAARATPKLKPIRGFGRDVFRAPLTSRELARCDAVVLDPPRPGAKAQAEALAGSSVAKIVMVSCNPGTCARDLRILMAATASPVSSLWTNSYSRRASSLWQSLPARITCEATDQHRPGQFPSQGLRSAPGRGPRHRTARD